MSVSLPYGSAQLSIKLPENITRQSIQPQYIEGLSDEKQSFAEALQTPFGCPSLHQMIEPSDTVAIVIPDITRALPSKKLLTWLFELVPNLTPEQTKIIIGTGTHRPNTPAEIEHMVGAEVAATCTVVNHDAFDTKSLSKIGKDERGHDILMNSEFVSANKRIIMGFIEPHFMAGFSGGYKAVFPGIADLDSIMYYHRAAVIGDPQSTWGNLTNNPTQEQVRYNGKQAGIDFCVNLTLNNSGQITGFFCGDVISAHDKGCAFAKGTAMVKCPETYPIVITSNSGFPLDQNLYQTVKGMSAAAQIVEPGGLIIMVARCNDGFPDHGNFKKLLYDYESPQAFLDDLFSPGFQMQDQWQNQLLALIQLKARVAVFSELPPEALKRAHIEPIANLEAFIANEIAKLDTNPTVAILPEGPMTIPYLSGSN